MTLLFYLQYDMGTAQLWMFCCKVAQIPFSKIRFVLFSIHISSQLDWSHSPFHLSAHSKLHSFLCSFQRFISRTRNHHFDLGGPNHRCADQRRPNVGSGRCGAHAQLCGRLCGTGHGHSATGLLGVGAGTHRCLRFGK